MNMHGENLVEQKGFKPKTIANGDIGQESLLETLLRQRWTVLTVLGIVLAGVIVYLIKATPIYTSSSSLYVEQTGPKLINEHEGVMTRSKNYLNTQGEVIRSTPILAKAVEKAQIRQFRTFEQVDNPVTYLKKNLQVKIGTKDDIITVSFSSPYPEETAQLVNEVVSSYIDYHASQNRSTVTEVLRILQKEKVKRDKELSEKFDELLEFTRANGVTAFENQADHIAMRRLSALSDAMTKAQLETINARADLEAAEKMVCEPEKLKYLAMAGSEGAATAISNSEEREIRVRLRELQQRLEEARRQCTDEHPLVMELAAKISHLQEQLGLGSEEFADAYIEVLRRKYETAGQREGELLASFNKQQQEAQALGLKATEYSVLQSELKRTERLCEVLDDRIKELNVTEDAGALNISVLEVARIEDKPSKPRKAHAMAIALVLGVLLGCGSGVLRDWLDYRLRSVEEISAALGVPVLGVVPEIADSAQGSIVARGRKAWLSLKELAAESRRKTSSRSAAAALGRAEGGDGFSARIQNRRLVTQLVMDCGRKMISRLMPIISEACKGIGLDVHRWSSRIDATKQDSAAEPKASCEPKADRSKAKGWLKSQATVAEVYQRRLDRALFGTARKENNIAKGRPKTIHNAPGPAKDTVSHRGQEIRVKPKSGVAEAYRTIRTAVFFGVPKDEAKTILITSPGPGDGKSTLASNLAIAMAQAGQKTLIIDCDFRKPTQHTIFHADNQTGVSNIFAENLSFEQAIQHGPVEGLDILTRGPEVPNPCEILNSEVFIKTIKRLSERYDRIIIDSAPVTVVADSQILSAISDVTIVVLKAEKSTRRLSQQAMHNLLSVGARVIGVVVNCVPVGGGHYGYYYGYGYYGKYGHYGYYGREKKDERNRQTEDSREQTDSPASRRHSEVKV